jgi:hypothetical protein
MADRRRKRHAPRRALIAPLAVLAGGVVAGVMLWRLLMLEPPSGRAALPSASEQISQHDRQALERLLDERRTLR